MGAAFTELFSGSLFWRKEQHFYDKLWDNMGSESLGSVPPAQLPYISLKDKSAWVYTSHGNGRCLATLNTHKPRRQWAYYYLFSEGKKTGIVMEFLWRIGGMREVLARCFISLTKNNLSKSYIMCNERQFFLLEDLFWCVLMCLLFKVTDGNPGYF